MNVLVTTVLTGMVAFASANIDDLFVLTLFFSQTNTSFRRWHVVLGQYLGFTVLVIISALASLSALVFPKTWIGLLGFLPIGMGIAYVLRTRSMQAEAANEVETEKIIEKLERAQEIQKSHTGFARFLNPQIYAISAVTIANGADNVGIFTPLFASSGITRMVITILVFYIGVGVWLYAGNRLARYPMVVRVLERYGDILVPLVLVSLGIYILVENDTFSLLPWFR